MSKRAFHLKHGDQWKGASPASRANSAGPWLAPGRGAGHSEKLRMTLDVGMGMTPTLYLASGDVMQVEIEHLGHQRQQLM